MGMDSAILIEAVRKGKKGDKEALTDIYNSTQSMVYFNALKLTQNEDDALDIVQDTYIQAFRNLGKLRDEAAFIKWLKTIVINLSKNHLKKSKPLLFDSDEKEEQALQNIPEVAEDFLPEEYADKKEKCRLIMEIVDRLPDLQRTAIMFYYYNGLSVEEVAEIMETKDGTIKSRLNYARKKIKDEVEEHEKQGVKLYSVGSLPILARILHMASDEYVLPEEVASSILSASLDSLNQNSPIVEVPSGLSKPPSGLLGKFMAAPLLNKIVVTIVAAALVVGGSIGIRQLTGSKSALKLPTNQEIIAELKEALGGLEWDNLLGKTREEVIALLGEPDDIGENGDQIFYNNDTTGIHLISVLFHDDNTVTMVSGYGDGFSLKGIKVGDTLDMVKSVFADIDQAVLEEEGSDRGSLLGIRYTIDDDVTYNYLYDEDGSIKVISSSKIHRTVYVHSQSQAEADKSVVEPKEPLNEAKEPASEAEGPAGGSEPSTATPASSEDNIKDKYRAYFLQEFRGTNAQAFFADITHDGVDEMLVVYGDLMEGYLEVYTMENGSVTFLYDLYTSTMTNWQYAIGLYEENGKDYLLNYAFFQRQGYPYYFYDIFSLEDGSEKSLYKKGLEFSYDENGDLEGISERDMDQFDQELDTFARKSKLLVSGTWFPGYESSMDLIYGKGETFQSDSATSKIALDRLILTDDMTIMKALGNPVSIEGWEIIYDGLAFYSYYGGIDTLHITSGDYSVRGVYVGQSKADALSMLKDTTTVKEGNVIGYVFRDSSIHDSFDFVIVPTFQGDKVSELAYQVYFGD
jgi:RNA polymerase sigma factor (sigma-70 family)